MFEALLLNFASFFCVQQLCFLSALVLLELGFERLNHLRALEVLLLALYLVHLLKRLYLIGVLVLSLAKFCLKFPLTESCTLFAIENLVFQLLVRSLQLTHTLRNVVAR